MTASDYDDLYFELYRFRNEYIITIGLDFRAELERAQGSGLADDFTARFWAVIDSISFPVMERPASWAVGSRNVFFNFFFSCEFLQDKEVLSFLIGQEFESLFHGRYFADSL